MNKQKVFLLLFLLLTLKTNTIDEEIIVKAPTNMTFEESQKTIIEALTKMTSKELQKTIVKAFTEIKPEIRQEVSTNYIRKLQRENVTKTRQCVTCICCPCICAAGIICGPIVTVCTAIVCCFSKIE